jgi:hypothetical protein
MSNRGFRKIFIEGHNFIQKPSWVLTVKLHLNLKILRHHHNQEKLQAKLVKFRLQDLLSSNGAIANVTATNFQGHYFQWSSTEQKPNAATQKIHKLFDHNTQEHFSLRM